MSSAPYIATTATATVEKNIFYLLKKRQRLEKRYADMTDIGQKKDK